ncbi:MAG TPA: ABC transporter permease [Flavisolibacter sp.]|nr:ABC transporter permease [Flavisolibacter sp.]
MFKNYLKVSLRNLWKNKAFSSINIFGLATGIACSLLIFLFVKDEMSYDNFHKDADHIYRVVKDFVNDDGSLIPDATTQSPLAPAMQREIPEVATVTRIRPNWGGNYLIKYGDKKFTEEKLYGVDSSFFDVFTFPFIQGNAKTAFKDVNSIVLTESSAKKIFGKENPIGKIVNVDAYGDMMVSGVIKDVPSNSHFHFDYLVSYHKQPGNSRQLDNWNGYNDYTYVKVKPGTNIPVFVKKIQQLNDRNVEKSYSNFYVQPIKDIHLTSNLKWELEPNGDKQYVYIFTLIALFIIIIAGINYMNLSTAKASVRAKEIGVRKVAGALRSSLVNQFLFESVITCLFAAIVAIGIAQLLIPVVNDLTGKQLSLLQGPGLLYAFVGSMLLGVLAGFFPALYLSSFQPISVLKGLKLNDSGALSLRKALVVVQFSISIILIIGAVIISQQMHYLRSAKLGFNTDQVVAIRSANFLSQSNRSAFKNELKQITGVRDVTASNGFLPNGFSTSRVSVKGSTQEQQVNFIGIDYNFLDLMQIKIKEGRGFSPNFPGDTLNNGIPGGPLEQTIGSIILNETAIKELQLSSPIGKQILWATDKDTNYYVNIVGVVKDFHFTSLRNEIKPFAFFADPRAQETLLVKLLANNIDKTLAQIQSKWKEFPSERALDYTFLDETFARLYSAESRFQKVFISLVILGILIACLGLLGLATFAAQQRVKEIGIRKVLGASIVSIVQLLSKDFLKLVLIAFVIALPVGWYAANRWLQDFAYRIDVKWWVFLLAGLIAVMIAFVTISFQTIKAAIANPVKNLRTE